MPPERTRLGRGAEFDLIRALAGDDRPLPPHVVVGPGDDCAVLAGGITLTCDMVVEDVHFRRDWLAPDEIGYRAAAAALSDLAAMAAEPRAVLVAYGLPDGDSGLARALHDGVESACDGVGAPVVGGDVTRSPAGLVIDVTAVGHADPPILRSGARPGDEVWVTGRLGAAAAAVEHLRAGRDVPREVRVAFTRPRPRIAEARWLAVRGGLTALVDLSDGLAGDAGHVAAASGVTLVLEQDRIPVADGAGVGDGALHTALSGGEDYELLLAARPGAVEAVAAAFRDAHGVSLTRIGRVEERGAAPVLLDGDEGPRPLELHGFDHFRRSREE